MQARRNDRRARRSPSAGGRRRPKSRVKRSLFLCGGKRPGGTRAALLAKHEAHLLRRLQLRPVGAKGRAWLCQIQGAEKVLTEEAVLAGHLLFAPARCLRHCCPPIGRPLTSQSERHQSTAALLRQEAPDELPATRRENIRYPELACNPSRSCDKAAFKAAACERSRRLDGATVIICADASAGHRRERLRRIDAHPPAGVRGARGARAGARPRARARGAGWTAQPTRGGCARSAGGCARSARRAERSRRRARRQRSGWRPAGRGGRLLLDSLDGALVGRMGALRRARAPRGQELRGRGGARGSSANRLPGRTASAQALAQCRHPAKR